MSDRPTSLSTPLSASLPDGRATELGVPGTNPHYVPGGYIVFTRADGTVLAAPFSLRRLRLTGEPVPVLQGITVKPNGAAELAVAGNGTFAYVVGESPQTRFRAVTRDGVEHAIGTELKPFRFPRISQLAVQRRDTLFTDVYLRNTNSSMYDVFPGGREFLMLQEESRRSKLYVVVNWADELRRRMRSR